MNDTASHGAPQLDSDELRHTLSVSEVEIALTAAGVPRSRRQVIRYCETGMLDAVKVPGPSGEQWYVAPVSVPKVIGDLKQWEAQRARQGAPWPAVTASVTPAVEPTATPDTASHGAPEHAVSEPENHIIPSVTEPDAARPGLTELEIYEHPYVKRLEAQVDKLEGKLDAQVRRTEDIQSRSQTSLLELQRMIAVGQSQTLADFMLKAKDWMIGKGPDADASPASGDVDNRPE